MEVIKQDIVNSFVIAKQRNLYADDEIIEKLKKIVLDGKLSREESQSIVDLIYPPTTLEDGTIECYDIFTIEVLKKYIKNKIIDYRYQKQEYFLYDGHKQHFSTYDIQRMNDMGSILKDGKVTSIEWKYAVEEDYVTVADYNYFINMRDAGYINEQKVRGVEKHLIEQLDTFTLEELQNFNVEEQFNMVLSSLQ